MPVVSQTGVVWNVELNHAEVNTLTTGAGVAALAIPPPVDVAVAAVPAYVALIDQIGGDNGVDISGVIGAAGVIVTPRGLGAYGWLVKGANIVVDAGKTIGEFILKLVGSVQHGRYSDCRCPCEYRRGPPGRSGSDPHGCCHFGLAVWSPG